eukprot:NODE_74_length_24438_cov_0.900283.p12 type:complete len:134 gc:universal NODE_74_length_24438_cov_0.900283:17344-17745(+)
MGSSNSSVHDCFIAIRSSSFCKNLPNNTLRSFKAPSPCVNGVFPESSVLISSKRPSIVVNLPPRVPEPSSKSISGMEMLLVSLFKMSRLKSSISTTLSTIFLPFSDMAPADLTSFDLYPQLSQTVDIITTSLK